MSDSFFYDSYAVLAYASGHPLYAKYFDDNDGFLTKLNLMEVFYRSLEIYDSRVATDMINGFSKYLIEFGMDDIKNSMKLRLDLKRRGHNVSYADAVGYFISKKMRIKFLTGDRAFEKLSGVEYIR
jgi:hypothetical protein